MIKLIEIAIEAIVGRILEDISEGETTANVRYSSLLRGSCAHLQCPGDGSEF